MYLKIELGLFHSCAAMSPLRAADGLPPFPPAVQASLQAADHVLLQPQVKVEGEVEPGGLANFPRHAAQAGDPGGG